MSPLAISLIAAGSGAIFGGAVHWLATVITRRVDARWRREFWKLQAEWLALQLRDLDTHHRAGVEFMLWRGRMIALYARRASDRIEQDLTNTHKVKPELRAAIIGLHQTLASVTALGEQADDTMTLPPNDRVSAASRLDRLSEELQDRAASIIAVA